MFLSRDKEDDDEFIPNPNCQSNLAAIFGNSSIDGNPSLVYSAPKQPKPPKAVSKPPASVSMPATASTNSTRVVILKQVQAFKLVDGAYQAYGRVAVALYLCSTAGEAPVYQLLLNKDRRNYLCNMRVIRHFNYRVQPKNYATFYTDKIVWSILFDSPSELMEFSLQVALARWRCGDPTSAVFHQDLWCGAASAPAPAAVGDTVEVLYSLHTLADCQQDCEEGRGAQRVSVTVEGTGWTNALVDTRPTTKRVLFLQPFMLGDLNPTEAVHSSPVVVRLTVLQVSGPTAPAVPPPDTVIRDLPSLPRLPSSASVSVSSASAPSPQPSKADLITRMARMGQPLPFKTAAPTPSDSDDTEEDISGRLRRSERSRSRGQPHLPPATPPPPVTAPAPAVTVPVPVQWTPTSYLCPQGLYSGGEAGGQFNMFLSEVRTTNSELRMGLTRLTDKVDKLGDAAVERRSEGSELVAAVERLLDNERHLRSQLESVSTALSGLQLASVQPAPAPAPCQRCAASDTLTEKLKKLEDENEYLKASSEFLKEAAQNAKVADRGQLAQIATLSEEVAASRSTVSELTERLAAADRTVEELRVTVCDQQRQVDRLEQCLRDSEAVRVAEVKELLGHSVTPAVGDHVKAIFNIASRFIKSQFQPDSLYDVKYISRVFSETVRGVALEYLERGGNITPSDMDLFNKPVTGDSPHQRGSEERATEREIGAGGDCTSLPHNGHGECNSVESETSCPEPGLVNPSALEEGVDSTDTEVDYVLSNKLHTLLQHLSSSQTSCLLSLLPPPSPPPAFPHSN